MEGHAISHAGIHLRERLGRAKGDVVTSSIPPGKPTSLQDKLSLISLQEGEASRDDILNLFLEHVSELGLSLYPAQEEAVLALLEWKHVVLNTPTGSGKSLAARALHFQAMAEGRISYYTCPIKALVNEKFFDLCDTFGPENVGLMTGDASVNTDAPIICCTAEILANRALRDEHLAVDYVVVDEFHFYGDKERGWAWQIPLITLKDTMFLLMSATLGDMSNIVDKLSKFTNRETVVVTSGDRPVPLNFEYRDTPIHETVENLIAANEAPIYLVNFTQKGCAEQAQALCSLNICPKEDKRAIQEELCRMRFDTPYGKDVRRFLGAGIGIHHAGLLPKYRLLVEKLSQAGLLKVICGTDSLGVGVNIPIRSVVFRALSKWDGDETRILSARQFHQISGRAGRKGFDDHGLVVVEAPEHVIENKRIDAKIAANPHLKKKLHRARPPERGYVPWDESTFNKLLGSPPEPLVPRFTVNHGMLVNVLLSETDAPGGGYRRLMGIIDRSHLTPSEQKAEKKRAAQLFRSLRSAGIAEVVPNADRPGATMRIRDNLQLNFSLNQTLSLYLVETLEALDPEADTYSLDMMSLVESVLENPDVILYRQVDRIKDELMSEMRSQGASYEERMEALEKVEHPKPLRDFIYDTFNAFATYHPWVEGENIRPKTVAREIYEKCMSFSDYVSDLGIARSEGVLLRYLSQAYKTASQSVPESFWTEEFEDILNFLLTAIERTDTSLLDEWEKMMSGDADFIPRKRHDANEDKPRLPDLAKDLKKLSARVRGELHMLQRSLATKNFEQAESEVRQNESDLWTKERFAEAMAPYFEQYRTIDLTPAARTNDRTIIREVDKRIFEVVQKIVDPNRDEDFAIFGYVDLTEPIAEDAPLVTIRRIGT
jgi:superfamily II RNA helicase